MQYTHPLTAVKDAAPLLFKENARCRGNYIFFSTVRACQPLFGPAVKRDSGILTRRPQTKLLAKEERPMISEIEAYEKALALHPKLKNWRNKDYDQAEKRDGVNWRLHILIDGVVLRRASDPSLPDAEVIEELKKRRMTEADAIHEIARIVAEDMWESMRGVSESQRNKKPLDESPAAIEARNAKTNRQISALVKR